MKLLAREGTVLSIGLVDDGDVRRDLLVFDQPVQHRCRSIAGVRRKAGQFGVYLPVCQNYDVPLLACEGFTSYTRKQDIVEIVAADPRPTVFLNWAATTRAASRPWATSPTGHSTTATS